MFCVHLSWSYCISLIVLGAAGGFCLPGTWYKLHQSLETLSLTSPPDKRSQRMWKWKLNTKEDLLMLAEARESVLQGEQLLGLFFLAFGQAGVGPTLLVLHFSSAGHCWTASTALDQQGMAFDVTTSKIRAFRGKDEFQEFSSFGHCLYPVGNWPSAADSLGGLCLSEVFWPPPSKSRDWYHQLVKLPGYLARQCVVHPEGLVFNVSSWTMAAALPC